MEQKVSIPRWLLSSLIGGLVLCLLSLAFLLGRESARSTEPEPIQAEAPLPLTARDEETPAQVALHVEEQPAPKFTPRSREMVVKTPPAPKKAAPRKKPVVAVKSQAPPSRTKPQPAQPPSAPPPAAPKAPPARADQTAVNAGDKAQIQAYFQSLDSVMAATPAMEDPNALATELLQSSMTGDTSGMDSLLQSTRTALAQVEAIKPPTACAEHHRLTVKQLRAGVNLLSQVGSATSELDTGSLAALSSSGQGLRAEAERLQQLDSQLRQRAR